MTGRRQDCRERCSIGVVLMMACLLCPLPGRMQAAVPDGDSTASTLARLPVSMGVHQRLGTRFDAGLQYGVLAASLTVYADDDWSRHRGVAKLGMTLWLFPVRLPIPVDPFVAFSFCQTAQGPVDYIPENSRTVTVGARVFMLPWLALRPEVGWSTLSSNILSGLAAQGRETNQSVQEWMLGASVELDLVALLGALRSGHTPAEHLP